MAHDQADLEPRLRRRSTDARHRDLQGRLLAAAEAAISVAGVGSLRARDLADSVGCSVGAIYGVFPDLDALILAVNARTLDAIDLAMRDAGAVDGPVDHLVRLAEAYLDYAANHRRRWDALFQHRMSEGHPVTPSYGERQTAAFARIEAPLSVLWPGLTEAERALLARTLFSAVHGMVQLGLDEKLAAMPLPVLRAQVRVVVEAVANGLARA